MRLVPLSWPPPVRVAWWLLVAAAALRYRLLLARAGLPQSHWATAATAAPFVVFAVGVATGAGWATWH